MYFLESSSDEAQYIDVKELEPIDHYNIIPDEGADSEKDDTGNEGKEEPVEAKKEVNQIISDLDASEDSSSESERDDQESEHDSISSDEVFFSKPKIIPHTEEKTIFVGSDIENDPPPTFDACEPVEIENIKVVQIEDPNLTKKKKTKDEMNFLLKKQLIKKKYMERMSKRTTDSFF